MSLTILTPASTRLLASVDMLQGDQPFENGALAEELLDQASSTIEDYCGYMFAQQVYLETLPRQRWPILQLNQRPIVSVTGILIGEKIVTDFHIHDAKAGLLYRREGWWYGEGDDLPYVSVTYTAGYILPGQMPPPVLAGTRLPGALVRATLEMVKVWQHELIPAERITSKTFGLTGDRVDYGVVAMRGAIPPMTKRLIDPYRRMTVA